MRLVLSLLLALALSGCGRDSKVVRIDCSELNPVMREVRLLEERERPEADGWRHVGTEHEGGGIWRIHVEAD